jgi:uncharacterized protein YrzB (UPF0473 family)
MIVKIEKLDNNNDIYGYYYYEANYLEYLVKNLGEVKKELETLTNYVFLLKDEEHEKNNLPVKILIVQDNKDNNYITVITARKTYILNENGKTIDVLY